MNTAHYLFVCSSLCDYWLLSNASPSSTIVLFCMANLLIHIGTWPLPERCKNCYLRLYRMTVKLDPSCIVLFWLPTFINVSHFWKFPSTPWTKFISNFSFYQRSRVVCVPMNDEGKCFGECNGKVGKGKCHASAWFIISIALPPRQPLRRLCSPGELLHRQAIHYPAGNAIVLNWYWLSQRSSFT